MKILIISDVHGNLPALERVINKHKNEYDFVISLGDVVNYGPWSNECVEFLETIDNKILIKGNHEDYFITGEYQSKNISKNFFDFLFTKFTLPTIIVNYQDVFKFEGFIFVHTIDNRYIFPDSEIYLDNNYFIGHSHKQMKLKSNGFVLYNPGSVGQNRTFINLIEYASLDTNTNTVEFFKQKYNVEVVIDKMIEMKYPQTCVDYYKSKSRY